MLATARLLAIALASSPSVFAAGCTKSDTGTRDSASGILPATADSTMAKPSTSPANAPSVRGRLASISDSMLVVTTPTGETRVRVVTPLHVYTRKPSDLAHVTPSSFVGVTSVKQPDGSERATEIHIFPEALRGTGEGSRLMAQSAGAGGRSTMTNGTVSGSRMTNGTVNGSRMTNGTSGGVAGDSTLTVTYQGGSQTIRIPAGVTVTEIALSQEKLVPGASVVVLAKTGPDSTLTTSTVMLAPTGRRR